MPPGSAVSETKRVRICVTGVVQGVGFRPFVYKLATEHNLKGFVLNQGGAVIVEVEGPSHSIKLFEKAIITLAPPLSKIEKCTRSEQPVRFDESQFIIAESEHSAMFARSVAPDSATCEDCLKELFDPADRRYRYPFVNCTNCGPRFTIIKEFPYDRQRTTMSAFNMCALCGAEYSDPTNRRFHAQPNACPDCGPQLQYIRGGEPESSLRGDAALSETISCLQSGGIAAIKGLGGFHLCCDATLNDAVEKLRRRKHRFKKPFAVMFRSLAEIQQDCQVTSLEAQLLLSHHRPIVLCHLSDKSRLSPSIAPGLDRLGVMLPYTPLHHLLLNDFQKPLVMTSGNISEEPICIENEDALAQLSPLSDVVLQHDRPIASRYDDSVMVCTSGGESRACSLRRARGYAPDPIKLAAPPERAVLAVGAHLKNTFCITTGTQAYVSQHIGDLENAQAIAHFQETLERFMSLFQLQPELIACDLHPDYVSTSLAYELSRRLNLPVKPVQHHQAHIAACAAEFGITGPVLGVALDGAGYGSDGTIWGGEFLYCQDSRFKRVAHFETVPLIGGTQAVRNPWRMALAYLNGKESSTWFSSEIANQQIRPALIQGVQHLLQKENSSPTRDSLSPITSSCGRLFDAVAAVAGLRLEANYEGQAAMELEAAARAELQSQRGLSREQKNALDTTASLSDRNLSERDPGDSPVFPVADLVEHAAMQRLSGSAPPAIALEFHLRLAHRLSKKIVALCESLSLSTVCLSGGVFQNMLFLDLLVRLLRDDMPDLQILYPRQLPCNDGGISLGQAVIAGCQE